MSNEEHIPSGPLYPAMTIEIERMVTADQDMREKNLQGDDFWDADIDRINTEKMKEIVAQIGWPTVSKVGESGAHGAWLLIQHADHDVVFQEQCLELMKKEPSTEVDSIDIAYLDDRVRVNKGQPQLYGTQFTEKDGRRVPKLIENEAEVDKRRKDAGLDTIEEYTTHMNEKYAKLTQQE